MQGQIAHRVLTWIAGVGSVITTGIIISVASIFFEMHNTLIRMERLPGTVDTHELRLDVHDREIQYLKQDRP